jgi:hypothetical protein
VRFSNTAFFCEVVQLSKDESVHLAHLGACWLLAALHALHAAIAFDRHRASRHPVALHMETDGVEGAYHRAHCAGDAFLRVDQNEILLPVAGDCARWAHLLARRGITVPTLAREGREMSSPRGDVNPRTRWRFFEHRGYGIPALRVLDRAREFTLPTPDAPLRIYEDGFHLPLAFCAIHGRTFLIMNPCKKHAP